MIELIVSRRQPTIRVNFICVVRFRVTFVCVRVRKEGIRELECPGKMSGINVRRQIPCPAGLSVTKVVLSSGTPRQTSERARSPKTANFNILSPTPPPSSWVSILGWTARRENLPSWTSDLHNHFFERQDSTTTTSHLWVRATALRGKYESLMQLFLHILIICAYVECCRSRPTSCTLYNIRSTMTCSYIAVFVEI